MELEFKKIVAYLPHDLKAISANGKELVTVSWLCNFGENHLLFTNLLINKDHWKPVLRPLSDLIKEIDIDGLFVPMDWIIKSPYNEGRYYSEDIINIANNNSFDCMQYQKWFIDYLLEWHFDIDGLIKAGLAIDINEISKK